MQRWACLVAFEFRFNPQAICSCFLKLSPLADISGTHLITARADGLATTAVLPVSSCTPFHPETAQRICNLRSSSSSSCSSSSSSMSGHLLAERSGGSYFEDISLSESAEVRAPIFRSCELSPAYFPALFLGMMNAATKLTLSL